MRERNSKAFSVTSPIGLCILLSQPRNIGNSVVYPHYAHEILKHAGLGYHPIEYEELGETLPHISLLLTIGEQTFSDELQKKMRSWIETGGAWISVGGVCGLGDLLGADVAEPAHVWWNRGITSIGEGYLESCSSSHPILSHIEIPLHFFGGIAVSATKGAVHAVALDNHQRETGCAAVVENNFGTGHCILIAPDITGTVVRIQQGIPVTRDGIPAPDGTAPLNEGVLKCEDGIVLDWIFDRQQMGDCPGFRAFLQPVADLWRELLLCSIFYLADKLNAAVPLLWLYPNNLPALAHLSDDTDLNDPERARHLLDVLHREGVSSTWCILLPGYPGDLLRSIRAAGHESGMHFNALPADNKSWSEKEFCSQYNDLKQLLDGQSIVTNKNHYTCWQGDSEFFEWCSRSGIQCDESKGPSKSGDVGFLFGTCHPYLPVAPDGTVIDVLEIPFQSQDLVLTAPAELADALLKPVIKHHGILHLLFHPHHITNEHVEEALVRTIRLVKEQSMEWWTAERINRWERARRLVMWSCFEQSKRYAKIVFETPEPLPGATLLWLCPSTARMLINGSNAPLTPVRRWGFDFQMFCFNPESGQQINIELHI